MSRQKGMLISFAALLFAFLLTTTFFYMLYNMHFDSASDDFSGMIVLGSSYDSEPDKQTKLALGTMREELEEWASEHQAVLFYKGFSAAGIAAIDYAGWFEEKLNVSFTGGSPKTVIIQKSKNNLQSFVKEDILFPGVYNYHIVGEFDDENLPTFQGSAFFYYPLTDITDMEGLLYTSATDDMALTRLKEIVERTGRSVEPQTYRDESINLFQVIVKMLLGDFVSRSMLFTFLGLIFCSSFSIYMMSRESQRYMLIHHLYGATYLSLFLKRLLFLLGIAILGTLLAYILAKTQLHLIHQNAYIKVAVLGGIGNVLFASVIHTFCFISWKRRRMLETGGY